ncbi:hypothetical protein [Streptomyces sp. NEAU-YJ-81]|uniref:hypothetical protein n=1 Tax=Streptomyces sp. NEAU-YJ-81 TaxID=2820288 RepID=UPI001ABD3928|nr:hypothetical protein [Streptomyces sp. NEAU-YJ-81]MBO3680477.1 hypothetical protein [Streptomyces sp. NEAU-YJ-81]
MTRTKKTVVLWALATGMFATSASPALAERNQTVVAGTRSWVAGQCLRWDE